MGCASDVDQSQSIDEQLRHAIANKRLVELSYHGHRRVAEPHDYGVQNGRVRLLAYQVRGASSTRRSASGWRLLDVSKISRCEVLEETFSGTRGAAHQDHLVWDAVYARVG